RGDSRWKPAPAAAGQAETSGAASDPSLDRINDWHIKNCHHHDENANLAAPISAKGCKKKSVRG
ncbi:MAG: hypothetical protein O3B42_05300, partial [Actinomycetota bacterium]|nr:hypothetical protein [Actinomycetota bacterium]